MLPGYEVQTNVTVPIFRLSANYMRSKTDVADIKLPRSDLALNCLVDQTDLTTSATSFYLHVKRHHFD